MSIKNGIQNPGSFYPWGSSWYNNPPAGYTYNNLWSADNTTTGHNDNPVVKTVYDPCPVGFKMPASNAFTGFTADGQYNLTMNINGTDNLQTYLNNFGHNFWTSSSKTATIYFPASGDRYFYGGTLRAVGEYAYYWSAVPYDKLNGCHLYFARDRANPLTANSRNLGYAVRPVADE